MNGLESLPQVQSNVAFTLNLYTQTDNEELIAAQNMMLDAILNTKTGTVQ